MSAKTLVFLCIQGLMAHAIYAQCYGNNYNPAFGLAGSGYNVAGNGYNLANNGYNNIVSNGALACNNIVGVNALNAATINGGGFTVTSSSPIAPSGVSVVSEYVIEGPLTVGGQLPVLSSVAVDGQLSTSGAAGTSYSCGNGNVGIINEQAYSANSAAAANAAAAASNFAAANSAALAADLAFTRPSGCGGY